MLNRNSVAPRCSNVSVLCLYFTFGLLGLTTHGFQIPFQPSKPNRIVFGDTKGLILQSTRKKDDFVDVEFERSPDPQDDEESRAKKKTIKRGKKKKSKANSLFELSLESDPRWRDVRIPFIDLERQTAIECTVAFVVELEGVQYGIAVPSDAAAAITVENKDGTVSNFSPDDDENEELMEVMAAQLVEHVGEDLALKRTPRVLTIAGDLDSYTENWQEDVLPKPTPIKDLLQDDDGDEDLDWAYEFFRKELGDNEFQKTMDDVTTAEDIGDDVMSLFDLPGMGADGASELEELVRSLNDEEDPMKAALENMGGDPEDEGAALKLISYNMKDGKAYSLVKLTKPYTLVGRLAEEGETLHFELLSKEEEKLVIPKLESACQKDLEDAGLNLSP